jgi:hypothetical protein
MAGKKRLRAADFKKPEKIENYDFIEICKTYRIQPTEDLKKWFDDLVIGIAEGIDERGQKHQDRADDRERIRETLRHIKAAVADITRLGPSGRNVLKPLRIEGRYEAPVGTIPLPDMVRSHRQALLRRSSRTYTVPATFELVVGDALKEIERELIWALQVLDRQHGARGGPKTIIYREWLIINLAVKWRKLGRKTSTGPKSDFVSFCEWVAAVMGWPTNGMNSAIENVAAWLTHSPAAPTPLRSLFR